MIMKKKMLFFQQVVDDLLSISSVGAVGDVYPVVALRIVLPDELVEVTMRLDPLEPPLAFLHVSVDAEVCRLAILVLRIAHTTDGIVQSQ